MAEINAEIPENRCGFELQPEDIDVEFGPVATKRGLPVDDDPLEWELEPSEWNEQIGAVCCWRPVWPEHESKGYCIWHADVDEKPIDKLLAARADGPEQLDGTILRGVDAGDRLSFSGCRLMGGIFDDVNFQNANFINTILRYAVFIDTNLRQAVFQNADLMFTKFPNADLQEAAFPNAKLQVAKFPNANLRQAEFPDAELVAAVFPDTNLVAAKFPDANLGVVVFPDAELRRAEFPEANLHWAEFPNAELGMAKFPDVKLKQVRFLDTKLGLARFPDANLQGAYFTDVNARGANFHHANCQDAVFTRTDCRKATFTSALLYETVFADTRVNSQTTFSDPETTYYDSITSRPVCVYEEDNLTADHLPEDVQPLEAARWVYRRLETLHEDNALSEAARDFHISKEEAERARYWERGEYGPWAVKALMWYLTKHGESVKRILAWWGIVILTAGTLFSVGSGVKDSAGSEYVITSLDELGTIAGWQEVLMNVYFSITTFSTIMDGGLAPAGPWTRAVVAVESITGALLVALLVFVLGRRVAR